MPFKKLTIILLLALLSACSTLPHGFEPWPQAQQAFRQDALWHGGDGAASLALNADRTLWLFGDTFIGASRPKSQIVRNSLGLAEADKPLTFSWKAGPQAFFRGSDAAWLWPGSGLRLNKWLLLFLMEAEPAENQLGFKISRARAVMVTNPDAPPAEWQQYRLKMPQDTAGIILGSGNLLIIGDYLFALSAQRDSLAAHLVRWPLKDARRGDLTRPQYWSGQAWQSKAALSRPIFENAQLEFGVIRTHGGFAAIHTRALTDPVVVMRTSKSLLGPWSEPQVIYQPPEASVLGNLVYAAKPHPELGGQRLVISYAVNSTDFMRLLNDETLYYPVLIRSKPYLKAR